MHRNTVVIDTSGHDGKDGEKGQRGEDGHWSGESGRNGMDGREGRNGKDAKNVTLNLSVSESGDRVQIKSYPSDYYSLPLGDPTSEVIIKAKGGEGGAGGLGGKGGSGSRGRNGAAATQHMSGEDGQRGGNGGPGGKGGDGGDSGDGGNATIEVNKKDTDLLMQLASPQLSAGQPGSGGIGGSGGEGASGGSGGSPYFWTEAVYTTTHDAEGHRHTHIDYIPHIIPGGISGSAGSNGRRGESGRNGRKGKDGKLTINVTGEEPRAYGGRYDLSFKSLHLASPDGIIEPGESLALQEVTFSNTGLMPTPTDQPIEVSLESNDRVSFKNNDTLRLATGIQPQQTATLEEGLRFRVKEATDIPAIDSTYYKTGRLQFKATVTRVNKSFDTVSRQIQTFPIRYPVEISTVSIPPTISREEEAPVVIGIRNVSQEPLGWNATGQRSMAMNISLTGGIDNHLMEYVDRSGEKEATLEEPITDYPAYLAPQQTAYFAGTLKFNGDTPAYTQANLKCELHLDKLNDEGGKQDTIQRRHFKVQIADDFKYDEHADIVLVTNNQTSAETVRQWQEVGEKLGTSVKVWNTSLYSGMSYKQQRNDEGSFIQQMQGKLVIILNNEMATREHEKTHSTDCLDQTEILAAAKEANVSTYVVGPHFDVKKALLPLAQKDEHKEVVTDKFLFWRRPAVAHLKKRADELNKKRQKENPDQRSVPFYHFEPTKTPGFSLRPTWRLGEVDMRETLGVTHAHIAHRKVKDKDAALSPIDTDAYNIVKLLPFSKKLEYLERAQDEEYVALIKKAILSDLASELLAFAKYKWNGNFSSDKLSVVLSNLRTLSEHQFKDTTHLKDILLNHEYFVNRLPSNWDKYFFPCLCRRTRLKNVSNERLKRLFTSHFPEEDFSAERKNLHAKWDRLPREQLFNTFSAPCGKQVTFDTNVSLNTSQNDSELLAYQPKESHFTEGHHFFASPAAREEAIKSYEKDCGFEFRL